MISSSRDGPRDYVTLARVSGVYGPAAAITPHSALAMVCLGHARGNQMIRSFDKYLICAVVRRTEFVISFEIPLRTYHHPTTISILKQLQFIYHYAKKLSHISLTHPRYSCGLNTNNVVDRLTGICLRFI